MPEIPHPPSLAKDAHYLNIVQSAVGYAIITCGPDGLITSWSEGARRLLGWSPQEMLGQPMQRLFPPDDGADRSWEGEMTTAAQNGYASLEGWHARRDGTRFWASDELFPVRDESGTHITGYVKVLKDRTEQRQGDQRLRDLNDTLMASEARLQMALDVGGMGVWQCDLKTMALQWWPGMEAIHGLDPREVPARLDDYYQCVHPDDRKLYAAAIRDAIDKKSGDQLEYRIQWPDGAVRWIESRSKVLMTVEGQMWGMSGVCLDITERKRVESHLKFLADASAELAALCDYQSTLDKIAHLAVPRFADWCTVDMLSDSGSLKRLAVVHVDPARELMAREIERKFPLDPARLVDSGPWQVLRTGEPELLPDVTDEVLAARVPDPLLRARLRAVGLRSYLAVPLTVRAKAVGVISFVAGESGRHYTAEDLALAQDLARRAAVAIENANLLRALHDSDRAKDVFLATLAHELRNPLAPVWNGLAIIKQAPDNTQRVKEVVDMIERQVGQLSRLVDDLLDVSRITTGKIELKKQRTDLRTILQSAVETSRPHIDAAGHRLELRLPDEPTDMEADPVRLAQVFSNLLNNAARYTRPGGLIEVDVGTQPERLEVSVKDNGAGIAPDMLGEVFAPFTQVTHPLHRGHGGLGIGLSLVEGLVRLHGGKVRAHSEGLDRGSEFVVELPRSRSAPSIDPRPAPPPAQTSKSQGDRASAGRRILVVDDNRDAANTLAELLQMFGSLVFLAHDGASALVRVAECTPDVVLLDIGLPDLNGYEVARRIRAMPDIPQPRLIALTGWGQEQDKRLAAEAGFDEHWTKPVDPARLQTLG
jgi:PAS domain S-box-containing protein